MLTDYLAYDEVRAALGVSVDEIEDATLALPLYERGLLAELEDVSATLKADYATIAAITPENNRTAAQQAVYDAVRLFAPYAVAVQCSSSLPLFSPKQISDGKATMSRYADSPYREAIKAAKEKFDRYRARLDLKYAAFKSADAGAVTRTYGRGVSPTSDPVAGT